MQQVNLDLFNKSGLGAYIGKVNMDIESAGMLMLDWLQIYQVDILYQ